MYEQARHETLIAAEWDEELARDAIVRIVQDTHARFNPDKLWPIHPLDRIGEDLPESFKMLYFGAAGAIWALHYLKRVAAAGMDWNYVTTLDRLAGENRKEMNLSRQEAASFLMGDVGILLVRWQLSPAEETKEELFKLIKANVRNPTRELMWGAPGTMLAALFMFEWSQEMRWGEVFLESFDELWAEWKEVPELKCHLWTQDLYGRSVKYLGAVHGFAGNIVPMIRGRHLLDAAKQQAVTSRILETCERTARVDEKGANWTPAAAGTRMLVQHCHGAPGIITCLADLPVGVNTIFDQLLEKGGELTWRAGPLTKGPGLCHGTAGNGYAFLKLYRRTGQHKWLERARAFAMHSIEQSERVANEYGQLRYSLWTGDLGLAVYLWDCIQEDAKFPTMDIF